MNRDWSEKNKRMQALIGREASFGEGIDALIELRGELFGLIASIARTFPAEAFWQMPFAGAEGYHSKTLAYSMWHIFRIEDIVAHTLIARDGQVLFEGGWLERTRSPIITTGNEFKGDAIAAFSKALDVKALVDYCGAIMDSTNDMLRKLEYADLKRKFDDADRQRLIESKCVSNDENAAWLIDYWCGRDVKGLIRMPFSRHWIMHIEAMCRIKNRLCRMARRGVDPVAYCGLSCDHCFLTEWCGACRTAYNTCSYATESPDGICPNVACCHERGLDGCYECDELDTCDRGFYAPENDTNAVRAMAKFIQRHGKKALLAVLKRLHEQRDFRMIQEVLGHDFEEGLRILEESR